MTIIQNFIVFIDIRHLKIVRIGLNVRMRAQLLPRQSQLRRILQTLAQKLNPLHGQPHCFGDLVGAFFQIFMQITMTSTSEGRKPYQKFIEQAANRPNIRLVVVHLTSQNLRCHQ